MIRRKKKLHNKKFLIGSDLRLNGTAHVNNRAVVYLIRSLVTIHCNPFSVCLSRLGWFASELLDWLFVKHFKHNSKCVNACQSIDHLMIGISLFIGINPKSTMLVRDFYSVCERVFIRAKEECMTQCLERDLRQFYTLYREVHMRWELLIRQKWLDHKVNQVLVDPPQCWYCSRR